MKEAKADALKRFRIVIGILLAIYVIGSFILAGRILLFTLLLSCLMYFIAYSVDKSSKPTKEKVLFDDKDYHSLITHEGNELMYLYLAIIPSCVFLTGSTFMPTAVIMYSVVIMLISIVIYMKFVNLWLEMSYLLFEDGFRLMQTDYCFSDVKKYQFITSKRGATSLEINTGDSYHRFKLKDDQIDFLRGKLQESRCLNA